MDRLQKPNWKKRIQKFFGGFGIFLMLALNIAPILEFLTFPQKARADAGTAWTKSGSNPVITTTNGYPRVIKDGSTYKMWMEAGTGNIKYATSSDGITWSAFEDVTGDENVHEATIIKDGSTFKMWYNKVGTTGYRESTDGVGKAWGVETVVSFNMTNAWDTDRITPYVLKDGSTYKMYYNASEGNGKYYIAYATSSDGLSWTEPTNLSYVNDNDGNGNNNLVLKQGISSAWDGYQSGEALYSIHVLKNTSNTYEMWYGGNETGSDYKIGYARSTDGVKWTKYYGNPTLSGTASQWDATGAMYPSVVEGDSNYQLWYTNNWSGNVGYATASKANTTQLLVVDKTLTANQGRVIVIDKTSNQITWEYPGTFPGALTLDRHSAATQLSNGNIAIADSGNNRVLVVDGEGNIVWNSDNYSATLKIKSPKDVNESIPGKLVITESSSNSGTVTNYSKGRVIEVNLATNAIDLTISADDAGIDLYGPYKAEYISSGDGSFLIASSTSGKILVVSRDKSTVTAYSDGNGWRTAYRYSDGSILGIIGVTKRVANGDTAMSSPIFNSENYPSLNADLIDKNVNYVAYNESSGNYYFSYNSFPSSIKEISLGVAPSYTVEWDAATQGISLSYPKDVDIIYQATSGVGDTTPPTITSVSSDTANGSYNAGDIIDIDVTFSEAVTSTGNVTVTLETGDTDRTCTFTVSNSTTGTCNYTVQAGDTSSDLNVNSISGTIADQSSNAMVNFVPTTNLSANKALVIDTTSPTVAEVTAVTTPTNDNTPNYTFSSTEAGTITYGGDCSSATTAASAGNNTITFNTLTDGTHSNCTVRVTDAAGNISNIQTVSSFVIDTVIPDSTVAVSNYYNSSPVAISGTASNGSSGVASVSITIQRSSDNYYWTGTAWQSGINWLSTTYASGSWSYSFSGSIDGLTYTIYSRATDNAGNVEGTYGTDSFSYDTTAPSSIPTMNNFYTSGNWTGSVSGTASDDTSQVSSVQVKVQRSSDSYYWTGSTWQITDPGWQAVSSGTTSWTYTLASANLTNAVAYTVTSRATDGAGNIESTGTDTFMYHNMNWQQYRLNGLPGTTNLGWFSIYKDGSTYKMWYMKNNAIYYATSTNGVTWEEGYGDLPVLQVTASQWDSSIINDPVVIKDGSTYRMWYAGNNDGSNNYKIGYATSTDGTSWTKHASNPVLTVGAGAAWDNLSVRKPTVIKDGSTYKLWYSGTQTNNSDYHLGYATSSDGITWNKSGSNPVLQNGSVGEWDSGNIWAVSVIQRGSIYEMYYSGNGAGDYQIGYAYSNDGITWTEYGSNPVLTLGSSGSWSDAGLYAPYAMQDGTTYKIWYVGSDGSQTKWGYATMDAATDSAEPNSNVVVGLSWYGPNSWNNSTTIMGTATDDWGVEKVELTIRRSSDNKYWTGSAWSDSQTWVNSSDYSGNGYLIWNYTLSLANLTDAVTYTVTSRATDGSGTSSGNVETSLSSDSFTWDSTNPTATVTQLGGASPATYYNTSLFSSASGTASDATSGVNSVYLSIKRSSDNKYWRNSTSQWETTQTWDTATGTTSWSYSNVQSALLSSIRSAGDGIIYTIYAAALDNVANNADLSTQSSILFTYDNTGPTTGSVNDGTGADSDYTSATTQLAANWSGFADSLSGVASYQYSIGTTSGGTDITSWISTGTSTSVTKTGLTLSNGQTYYVNVRGVDNAGNTGSVASSDGITIDTSLPTSTPTMNDYYNSSSWANTITGTASATVGIFQVELKIQRSSDSKHWDGDSWEVGSSWLVASSTTSWTYALAVGNLSDGATYTISSRATDNLSRLQDPPNTDTFTYDTTNPTAPASANDGTGTDSDYTTSLTQLSANWTSSTDATSGIQKYQYAIGTTVGGTNTVSWTDNSTNTSVTRTGLSLTNGQTYYFTVRAVDNANNTGSVTNSDGIMVDNAGPAAPGTPADSGTYSSNTSQTWTWTAASDAESGVAGYYISIGTTAGATDVVNNLDLGNVLTYTRNSLSNGVTYFAKVRAYDAAGNTGTYSANSNGITIDTTAPTSDPQLSRTYYSASNWLGSITVNLTDATSGVQLAGIAINRNSDGYGWCDIDLDGTYSWTAGYTCYTDYSSPGSSFTYTFSASNLTTGQAYTIDTYARDNAANIETPHTQETFTYDNSGPSTPTVNDGTSSDVDSVESLTTLSANWTAATDEESGVTGYEYAIGTSSGGINIVTWTSASTATSVTRSDLTLSVGTTYYFSVRATNGAATTGAVGNSDGTIISDGQAPSVLLSTSPSSPTGDSTPQFTGTATDSMTNISTIQYRIDSGEWIAISAIDGTYDEKTEEFNYSTSTLSEGSHTIYLRAFDSSGNTTTEVNYTSSTFAVDLTVPNSPGIDSPKSGEILTDNTPTFRGTGEGSSTILLTVSSDPKSYSTTTDDSGNWSYTIPDTDALEDGSHSLAVKVRDRAGNESLTTTISFSVKTSSATSSVITFSTSTNVSSGSTVDSPITTLTEQTLTVVKPKLTIIVDRVDVVKDSDSQKESVNTLPNTKIGIEIKPLQDKLVKSIEGTFEGAEIEFTDDDEDGVYSAQVLSPLQKGSYEMPATIIYNDGTTEEVTVEVLVDPYGYVYAKDNEAQEVRIKDTKVTLYVWENNKWQVWDASKYDQKNPQTTNQQGEYGFMVPEGKYYLEAEKEGYKTYKSDELVVEQGKPINLNIEMFRESNVMVIYIVVSLIVIAGAGIVYYRRRRKI